MTDLVPTVPTAPVLRPIETASTAMAAQAKALVEARYTVAINLPRDIDQVRERMLKECQRPGFAHAAIYRKPIGRDESKWPTGPSIRFAELAIRAMTNIVVDTITVYDDAEKRIVRVSVTDLEANVPYSQDVTVQKTVERRSIREGDTPLRVRTGSQGQMVYTIEATDDDILNKQNALISKAVRTLGLRLIPGDIIDECMYECRETQRKKDAQDPDAAKHRLFDSFGTVGVTVEQIKAYLGHDSSVLTPKELADLRALYSAIRDGEATWREVMDAREPKDDKDKAEKPATGKGTKALKESLKGKPE